MANATDFAVDPDILERLALEADLCRNEHADDIADLLDAAREEIERLRDRVSHITNISEGRGETIAELRVGLAELREMVGVEKSA